MSKLVKAQYPSEESIVELGLSILKEMQGETPSVFKKDFWSGKMMDLSMKDPEFKVEMFRFVDVFPALRNDMEIARHLQEYFCRPGQDFPTAFQWGLGKVSPDGMIAKVASSQIRKQITSMAERFIAGTNAKEALKHLTKMWDNQIAFTLDLLGEATVSSKEADDYFNRYNELIDSLAEVAPQWSPQPILEEASWGRLPRVNISIKISSLYSQIDPIDFQGSVNAVADRLRPILLKAKEKGVFVNLDMEHYEYKDLTIALLKKLLMEEPFLTFEDVGIAIQAYLRDTPDDLHQLIEWARKRGTPCTVRLIKGAYWDSETIKSQQEGWETQVWSKKWETDAAYESCTRLLMDNHDVIHLALGSHNVRSIAHAIRYARVNGIPDNTYEFQMLYGMAEPLKKAIQQMGFRLREYVPIGEMIPGMAYLVRRLLENTSNEGWLKQSYSDSISPRKMLANPDRQDIPLSTGLEHIKPIAENGFRNHPLLNFALKEDRVDFADAVEQVRKKLGKHYFPVVAGKKLETETVVPSVNPSRTSEIVGHIHFANIEQTHHAIETAKRIQPVWAKESQEDRSAWVLKIADALAESRLSLAAWMVFEVGKTWREADADVCEAIDFCRYYALEMLRLSKKKQHGEIPGELNLQWYQPRGVCAVISPWNFPLAILTGMTMAAIVSGNTAIMKPAEQSSVIAAKLMEVIESTGLPVGVVQYLPGQGEVIGQQLVNHPDVNIIAFTGSKEVGLHILEAAHRTQGSQRSVKKVVCEMGGKNAIIVDSDADLDEAVVGVLHSAFGFQGQKCSACSRVIVDELCYDEFRDRLIEATRSLEIGPADDPAYSVGPLIDEEAVKKAKRYIAIGREEGTILIEREVPEGGTYVGPTIIGDISAEDRLAQEEVFAPVLALIKARDFSHALEIANSTKFALTGGLFSRSPSHIERAREEFLVGNLYINRGCTGALVYRQPFGGFNMSGTGSKTGGPDYLLHYMEPRSLTENTMRRGFSPETVK